MINEKMSEAEQMTLMMSLRREMNEMKKKNEKEILALRRENEEMKRKMIRESPSSGPSNPVGRPDATPAGMKVVEEPKPTRTQETVGESYPKRSFPLFGTLDAFQRHPFTEYVMGAQLPPLWKGLSIDCYDGTNDPDENMDVYTTYMSLYTSESEVLCRVFPTSLKAGALSWFTRLPPNSIDCFETLVSKFGIQFATSRPHHLTSILLWSTFTKSRENLLGFHGNVQ